MERTYSKDRMPRIASLSSDDLDRRAIRGRKATRSVQGKAAIFVDTTATRTEDGHDAG
jgi:hypothetical protein